MAQVSDFFLGAGSCAGPFGKDLPPLLQNRPSGTKVPDWFVMAAPFTPFHANGSVNSGAVLPLAKLFKDRLGITAVWVMGMRGQFDAMTVEQRKEVALAWVAAGKATGLFTMIQCGSSSIGEAAEVGTYIVVLHIYNYVFTTELCRLQRTSNPSVAMPSEASGRSRSSAVAPSAWLTGWPPSPRQRPRHLSFTTTHRAGMGNPSTASKCTSVTSLLVPRGVKCYYCSPT